VDPREAKEIMSQGAIRPETPRDREEQRILDEELAVSPVKGRPLEQRVRNWRPDASAAIRALSGPPLWMRRLRAIEDELERHEAELGALWRELAEEVGDAEEFERRWLAVARTWSFAQVNHLIDRHNTNFPAEARLPMDPRTRDFVRINGKPYRRDPLDTGWILERYPPRLETLRIDVDDGREAGAAHRDRGGP
jgi:hypothetical protein